MAGGRKKIKNDHHSPFVNGDDLVVYHKHTNLFDVFPIFCILTKKCDSRVKIFNNYLYQFLFNCIIKQLIDYRNFLQALKIKEKNLIFLYARVETLDIHITTY